ncbi:MAG TPA: hypothetical protein VEJ43_00105 [Pseudolabrys sp.]|nr:hypothetical protein [Pseudolabrys sp.]
MRQPNGKDDRQSTVSAFRLALRGNRRAKGLAMYVDPNGPYGWMADNFWGKLTVTILVIAMMVYASIQNQLHGDTHYAYYLGVKYELPGQNAVMLRTNPDLAFVMPRNDNFEGMLAGCHYRFNYDRGLSLFGNETNRVRSAKADWCPPPAIGQRR